MVWSSNLLQKVPHRPDQCEKWNWEYSNPAGGASQSAGFYWPVQIHLGLVVGWLWLQIQKLGRWTPIRWYRGLCCQCDKCYSSWTVGGKPVWHQIKFCLPQQWAIPNYLTSCSYIFQKWILSNLFFISFTSVSSLEKKQLFTLKLKAVKSSIDLNNPQVLEAILQLVNTVQSSHMDSWNYILYVI